AEILVDEGETVEVGAVLARIASGSAALRAGPVGSGCAHTALSGGARASSPPPARSAEAARGYLSPVVQRLAAERQVDLARVTGTGQGGRIRKQDVLA